MTAWASLSEAVRGKENYSPACSDADALIGLLDPDLWPFKCESRKNPGTTSRLALVAESGYGKSVRLKWVRAELSRRASRLIPFLLRVEELPDTRECLDGLLLKQMCLPSGNNKDHWPDDVAEQQLKHWRETGRILLLLDTNRSLAKDQQKTLRTLLTNGDWNRCPVVISGTPQTLTLDPIGLSSVDPRFQFVRPCRLTDSQSTTLAGTELYEQLLQTLSSSAELLTHPHIASILASEFSQSRLSAC